MSRLNVFNVTTCYRGVHLRSERKLIPVHDNPNIGYRVLTIQQGNDWEKYGDEHLSGQFKLQLLNICCASETQSKVRTES